MIKIHQLLNMSYLKVCAVALPLLIGQLFGQSVFGQGLDLNPDEIRGNDQNTNVSVLQNRFFLKKNRPEIGISAGTILNESYTDTTLIGARFGFFFNEWLGVELQSVRAQVKDSDDRKALNRLQYRKIDDPSVVITPDPEVNPVKGVNEATATLVPLYGKISVADWKIVYTELYSVIGGGQVDTLQGKKNSLVFGAGLRTYWNSYVSTRIDFRDRTFLETRSGKDSRKHLWSVDFSVAAFVL